MELDLDSFLSDSDYDSDCDSGSNPVPHRTLDEILNDSDSFPPPSPPSSNSSPDLPSSSSSQHDAVSSQSLNPKQTDQSNSNSNNSLARPNSAGFVGDPTWRLPPSNSRPLPSLFDGVRSNIKPGDALAAAAAASRSVPTPHAAAIKSMRASRGSSSKGVGNGESGASAGDDHESVSGYSNGDSVGIGIRKTRSGENVVEENETVSDFQFPVENEMPIKDASLEIRSEVESGHVMEEEVRSSISNSNIELKFKNTDDEVLVLNDEEHENKDGNLEVIDAIDSSEEDAPSSPVGVMVEKIGEDSSISVLEEGDKTENDLLSSKEDGEGVGDESSSMSDISELVEERLGQLENERISRRAEEKLRSSMKPLELAEDLEKKQASTGLHWEEGAAAQPMRLEGVKRGSTTLGYFDIDATNVITRTIGSQSFMRDYGSSQVLAVNVSHIAVGTTRGIIVIIPSRYSPHNSDTTTDAKVSQFINAACLCI